MVKAKKNKRVSSDALHAKKSTTKSKPTNPFEIHLNKEKFSILGRKLKHGKGLPGVSRAKAAQKRKSTLGQEFNELHKTNKFKDRRIAGGNNDELAHARFTAEQMLQFKEKRKNLFNLNDDEVLTHRGQTLGEIEQFRQPDSDGSEDEELDAEFTEAAHFGGDGDKTDRKTAIDEMIAEAKRKKAEVMKDKDEVYELTNKLDASYKSLIPLMGKLSKNQDSVKQKPDDYDRALKEMIFEPRGEVTDKLQSEEDLAKKEKERLEKLENERLARMRGEEEGTTAQQPKHRSADALDDGYLVESGNEEEPTLAYDLNGDANETEDPLADDDEDEDIEQLQGTNEEENGEEDAEEEEEEEEETDTDDLSDLKESDSESEYEETEETKLQNGTKQKKVPNKGTKGDSAKKKLPYTYDMPESYEAFLELLNKESPETQGIIVDRIIKCNHPKIDPANRDKVVSLFAYILQYINDIFCDLTEDNVKTSFQIIDKLSPHIFDLIHLNSDKNSSCILEVIKEKYDDYKKTSKVFPAMDTIIFFKLVSNLFSTSDFRHPVVTPSFVFISHILARARVRNRRDISIGLLLTTIVLEYTHLSKRFLPAAFNYLLGIIYLAVPKRPIETLRIVPPFQSTGPQNSLLALTNPAVNCDKDENFMTSADLVATTIDEEFKVRALNTSLRLFADLVENMMDQVGIGYLVEPFVNILSRISIEHYPEFVRISYERARKLAEEAVCKPLLRLVAAAKKPKALRLMEPRIVKVYDDKRRPKLSKEKEMRAIMQHKIKRETKGAVREIRRDNAFLAKMQIKKQLQSDMERKEKVRRIYAEASLQQGELNALSRKRNKF